MVSTLQTLSRGQKALAALTGSGVALAGLVVSLSGYLKLPDRVGSLDGQIATMDARITSLEARSPQTEYLFCVDLADRGLITKTPQDCYQDYSLRQVQQ